MSHLKGFFPSWTEAVCNFNLYLWKKALCTTNITFKRFLFFMFKVWMSLQMGFSRKRNTTNRLTTNDTTKWLLSFMNWRCMSLQIIFLSKADATNVAIKLFLFCMNWVYKYVTSNRLCVQRYHYKYHIYVASFLHELSQYVTANRIWVGRYHYIYHIEMASFLHELRLNVSANWIS